MWFNVGSSWETSLSTLFLLFTLVLNVAAQTLGVTLDKSARDDAERFVYSAKLTFEEDTGTLFNGVQLYALARLAFDQMAAQFNADGLRVHTQPVMMAAMALGKNVYISSNIKGGPFLYTYADARLKPQVLIALERCQTSLQDVATEGTTVGPQHRTKASCAEIAALHQYYLDDAVDEAARVNPPPTRVVAFGRGGGTGPLGPQNPCGGGGVVVDGAMTWGCKQFMADEKITVPPKPNKKVVLDLPNPFPKFTTTQISIMCPGHKKTTP
ncbi:hypothetical protein CORC01_07397 [Colletotrichum orchidophilum]|uniref:Uncharacterized protein n=1 Tax=Colletotrichum orchidophilum TaxID=1209926 RepID=A0A1G4B7T5_9PEZI|nr:uncharacterized protein CORC01_07397 [Colletotrichum orchidophilum]OHE97342.1 hypothetical protein CORC01_07397 [Colletotrichum orchidophilum]